jgi:hypothetical protein
VPGAERLRPAAPAAAPAPGALPARRSPPPRKPGDGTSTGGRADAASAAQFARRVLREPCSPGLAVSPSSSQVGGTLSTLSARQRGRAVDAPPNSVNPERDQDARNRKYTNDSSAVSTQDLRVEGRGSNPRAAAFGQRSPPVERRVGPTLSPPDAVQGRRSRRSFPRTAVQRTARRRWSLRRPSARARRRAGAPRADQVRRTCRPLDSADGPPLRRSSGSTKWELDGPARSGTRPRQTRAASKSADGAPAGRTRARRDLAAERAGLRLPPRERRPKGAESRGSRSSRDPAVERAGLRLPPRERRPEGARGRGSRA